MAGQRKRSLPSSSSGLSSSYLSSGDERESVGESIASSSNSKKSKRQAKVATYEKWKRDFNVEHKTSLWLRCDRDRADKSLVSTIWCEVCRRYEDKLQGMRNYSSTWIKGSSNHKTSNISDHAKSDQHTFAMARYEADRAKSQGAPVQTYAPIYRSLMTLDQREVDRMKRKFEICYVMAKEHLAFTKFPSLCVLASHQGVQIGSSYKTADSAKSFTHFIAEAQRKRFVQSLTGKNFFSFLMDGTSDPGNVEQEMVLVVYCDKDDEIQEIKCVTRYLAVVSPEKVDSSGLIDCLGIALERVCCDLKQDVESLTAGDGPLLIGGGTDGASVNIGNRTGMKTKLQSKLTWLFWGWCFSHRLELACKDSFASKLFSDINEMLLRLYYLYKKSSKKSRELEGVVEDLKGVYSFTQSGHLPIKCQGTRWINFKRRALQRVVDRYGAYMAHLSTLVEDLNSSTSAVDRERLRGYVRKWSNAKIIIGCAMYVDALKPVSMLSLCLQEEKVDTVQGINYTLKTVKSLSTLTKMKPEEWPTAK